MNDRNDPSRRHRVRRGHREGFAHFLVYNLCTTNHAPLARRASMSCAQVETLTCDVVVNVLPASPPIISLSYTWSNERTSERTRVSQSVGRFFILPKSRHRDSSPPRTRSVKKAPHTFGTLFPPFFALASSFARRASSSRCFASASERFSARLALFFLLLLFAFLGSDDDDDTGFAFATVGRFPPPPFGFDFDFPLNARAMSGASAAPTRAKITNGDVDDVFADDVLRLVAPDPPRDDDDEEEEDPELCRAAMSIRPSIDYVRLVVWMN